jgi:hypothetical protein
MILHLEILSGPDQTVDWSEKYVVATIDRFPEPVKKIGVRKRLVFFKKTINICWLEIDTVIVNHPSIVSIDLP